MGKNHPDVYFHYLAEEKNYDVTEVDFKEVRQVLRTYGHCPLILGCWMCDLVCRANATVTKQRAQNDAYNPALFDPIRAAVFRVASDVRNASLELYPEEAEPFILLENARHNLEESNDVQTQMGTFQPVHIVTDAGDVSSLPRVRSLFTNIHPTASSVEEDDDRRGQMRENALWYAKWAEARSVQAACDRGEDDCDGLDGIVPDDIVFQNQNGEAARRLDTPRKSIRDSNFWRHCPTKKCWPMSLETKEVLMGYTSGYFSKLVEEEVISFDDAHAMIGDAWSIPQICERLRSIVEAKVFPSHDYEMEPYFWETEEAQPG